MEERELDLSWGQPTIYHTITNRKITTLYIIINENLPSKQATYQINLILIYTVQYIPKKDWSLTETLVISLSFSNMRHLS